MKEVVFVTGGARSGKSSFALKEAEQTRGRKAFIATLEPLDAEMQARAREHRAARGPEWETFEEPIEVAGRLRGLHGYGAIIVDCLTLWLLNVMHADRGVDTSCRQLASALREADARVFAVSNEVGMGIVPGDEISRRFRDAAGRLNQLVADGADKVYFIVSGIPIKLKG